MTKQPVLRVYVGDSVPVLHVVLRFCAHRTECIMTALPLHVVSLLCNCAYVCGSTSLLTSPVLARYLLVGRASAGTPRLYQCHLAELRTSPPSLEKFRAGLVVRLWYMLSRLPAKIFILFVSVFSLSYLPPLFLSDCQSSEKRMEWISCLCT